jgi:hypothetical protein
MQRIFTIDSAGLFLCIKYRHKSGMIYGYARVSTDGQSVEAQVRQLAKAGCSKVFREAASGAKTDRAQLRKALDRLEAGDVLMVTRLDRLARSARDLLNTLAMPQPLRFGQRLRSWQCHSSCPGGGRSKEIGR